MNFGSETPIKVKFMYLIINYLDIALIGIKTGSASFKACFTSLFFLYRGFLIL